MPKQIIRLFIAFVIFVFIFIVVRQFLVPESFGDLGHYRANSLKDNADLQTKFIGTEACVKCHKDIDSVRAGSMHAGINCEACHGPGNKHLGDPKANKLDKPDERDDCGICHSKNLSRAKLIKQVDFDKHNINTKCTKCHNAHNPSIRRSTPPVADSAGAVVANAPAGAVNCAMCHADIETKKKTDVHKSLACQTCHTGTAEKHQDDPAGNKLKKPLEREFCGKCHGKGIASASSKIKQVDLKEHNTDSKCIECHNPHTPWN